MAAVQLSFTLRTSSNVKTVHLIGSWDNYTGKLPLSKDVKSGKAGAWKGTFRFQGATLQPGQRYWYYYIMDGYTVSHDPAKPFTKEPTTGRNLNVLDVPAMPSKDLPQLQIPTGRALSPSRIACPKPSKPYASAKVREADYSRSPVDADDITSRLEHASLYNSRPSPTSSVSSGFSSGRSSGPDSPASLSSLSDSSSSSCRCNRYGITRSGKKVLLDCGGRRCGYSDDSSSACDSDEDSESDFDSSEDESEDERPAIKTIAPKKTVAATKKTVSAAPKKAVASSRRR